MADYTIEIINSQAKLAALIENLSSVSAFALDIETVDWWNRQRERVALIQIAFTIPGGLVKVAVIDALTEIDLRIFKAPLESESITKIIHNAAFDATRLHNHYKFKCAPIFDTMLAARRNGEKRYSLEAQSAAHLNLRLDKQTRQSDWSRRPLDLWQINYAALDAYAALRLYQHQVKRNLNGWYRLKKILESTQGQLPLADASEQVSLPIKESVLSAKQPAAAPETAASSISELPAPLAALLGIASELPTRYSPDALIVSVGSERVGLAGWIVDGILGRDADFDEESVRLAIADLFDRQLVRLTETRRLEATDEGLRLWQRDQAGLEFVFTQESFHRR